MNTNRTNRIAGVAAATFMFLTGSTAFAQDIFVNALNCPGPGTGTEADPYCTIQSAVNAALAGDTINVNDGLYMENVAIPAGKNGLTLFGDPTPPASVIDCGGVGDGLFIKSHDVIIDHMTIHNCVVGIFHSANRGHIDDNTIEGCDVGIQISAAMSNFVEDNNLKNNGDGIQFLNFSNSNFVLTNVIEDGTGNGVVLNLKGGRHNFIDKNTLTRNTGWGIVIDQEDNTLKRNQAKENLAGGYLLTTDIALSYNLAENNGSHGFEINGAVEAFLAGNKAVGNLGDGFRITNNAKDNHLVDNKAQGNSGHGFHFVDVPVKGNLLADNDASNNALDGFHLTNSQNQTLTDNTAEGNISNGFGADAASTNNMFTRNYANLNTGYGFADDSIGFKSGGTGNDYNTNKCSGNIIGGSTPSGLCPQP